MERFFPADKIRMTGNPVRQEIAAQSGKREEAIRHFGLDATKQTLLVIGGSLGALSINESILAALPAIKEKCLQLIWQTGKGFDAKAAEAVAAMQDAGIQTYAFIKEMDLAYAAADLVVSRAGALAVSELCLVKKACILVPYPFASEDHQTHNAQSLVEKGAAVLVTDSDARAKLAEVALSLSADAAKREALVKAISALGKPDATNAIVNEVIQLMSTK
jgi:UDP-N-acetylglucosamine--N-acetylmuramyl-(pentapeptide) pyrophosphoryl-undecaprenol N-acetylglucosamine transferase